MSNGPIVKPSPDSSTGLRLAGAALLVQAGWRAALLASFLAALRRYPQLGRVISGNVYALTTSIALPAFFVLCGAAIGFALLARRRAARTAARAFCVLGLSFAALGACRVWYAYATTPHHPPMQTYVLMAVNAAIYLGVLVAVSRSA